MKRTTVFLTFLLSSVATFAAMQDPTSVTASDERQLLLKGNIVTEPIALDYADNDTWYSENVTLDDSNVFLFSDKFVFFECPQTGYRSNNIRINGGTYTVSFNLNTKAWSFTAPIDETKISAFGSSVCNGQGATSNKGYAYLYGQQLQERYTAGVSATPFHVSGVSIGGNNTKNLLDRYDEMTRDYGRYVIIGLSMGNEGIHESQDKQATLNQFSTNMQTIISKIKADGKVPVVMNNYTRGDFTAEDYTYIKRMNLLIHQWDVSSVNTLGAIDDGAGHWASGYMQDNAHPTTSGHREFFYAMPPSLFDAIASGKSQPVRTTSKHMTLSGGSAITFRGEGTVHPFTISIRVKGNAVGDLFSFTTTAKRQAHIEVDADGHVVYRNALNRIVLTTENAMTADAWHMVTLTHYYAQGRTLLYLDGQSAGEVRERISFINDVIVGDQQTADVSRELSEVFYWRSAFSPEEVQALCDGNMLKSSLEIYVPTASAQRLDNLAMSLNTVQYVDAGSTVVKAVSVAPARRPSQFYNLSGQHVDQPRHGIYISNRRKVVK